MSPLSLQVKVNTQDPTHGAAVSALNETPLPGQPGTPGVNGRGGGQRQPPLLDVVLSGSPSLPGLSFSTTPYCSTASLSLSLFSLLPWALSSLCPRPFLMPREHTQASSNMHPITSTHGHEDRHRNRPRRRGDTRTGRAHDQKVSKGLSYLISIVIALSSTANPLVWLHRDYSKKKVQFRLRRRFRISQSLELTFKLKIFT